MATLNYHHLRLFRAVAQDGSLTRAAARLHLSQSALSTQLRKLEEQLGHRLFDRQGKRLILTEAGRIALDYADTVFKAGEELVSTLAGRPRSNRQVLRVGAITHLSRNFQLQFLRPLIGRTDIELVLRSGTMRELLAQLEAHTLDIVLANAAVRREAGTALHSHLLDRQPVSLVGPPIGDGRSFMFPDDLQDHPVILPSHESDIRAAFDRTLELAGIRPIIVAEVDDMAMLRLLARASGTLALVPPIVVRDELATGLLVERCRIPDLSENFYAIVQSRRFPNPLVQHLIELNVSGLRTQQL
ncbi:MAG: LysR family transcriptional regulator [Acidobacteriia bacterium]|nr:LysR family transcriptional regulator [Methyloceanibacter sp.]MCL6492845.1 LysR family transcriptional regulator [Terriglobia bacterium]